MTQYHWNACPADVREQTDRLFSGIFQLIPENVVGIYLHGSLAMGCFNPQRSDLDLLVITHTPTPDPVKPELARLLLDLSRSPAPIEIHFIQQAHLKPWQYPTPFDFHYSEGWRDRFENELQKEGWHIFTNPGLVDEDLGAHIMVVRQRGVCLYGANISVIFPEVPAKDYIDSILGDVLSDEYGLNSTFENPITVILNACRTLAYFKTGEILSKDEGGDWALWNLPEEFQAVVLKALCTYRSNDRSYSHTRESLNRFSAFMREQIAHMGHLRSFGEPPKLDPVIPVGSYYAQDEL